MATRREFLKAATAMGGAGLLGAIERAFAIAPEPGSSFADAEHVVILMQENRSFDHVYGSLSGVRGFNDPRAIRLADGNPVWVQAAANGERHVPFRADIQKTRITWMGSLPHGRSDQVAATNGGLHDKWLTAKRSGNRNYAAMPLTLGYHTREDVPFYYALADAFTVCDQNFCSSLTGTTPNRLHLWTGTIRAKAKADSPALVHNENCDYGAWCDWTTFPERLEDHGISWKIYQNELTVPNGLTGEADNWLANYGDSPIEWFTQFGVRSAKCHLDHKMNAAKERLSKAKDDLDDAEVFQKPTDKLKKQFNEAKDELLKVIQEVSDELKKFNDLSERQKNLHRRAFTTNTGDPHYRELTTIEYDDNGTKRKMQVPKGDIFHQFRKDVNENKLPAVSWLVAPEHFSDHPSSAWYGAWYISEAMNILTKNPAVWKKTVFILTYDENDGYFDHVPPFTPPHPQKPETGKTSKGIDATLEWCELEQRKTGPIKVKPAPIGLGYRVPMVIASPWTRGGCVCSQVFDHTSVIQFLETLFSKKSGKKLHEPNISDWRRAVCGDLTSAFQSAADADPGLKTFLARDKFVESIHKAQFEKVPAGFAPVSKEDLDQIRKSPEKSRLPRQEPGTRRSAPLPYQLGATGRVNKDRTAFRLSCIAQNALFEDRSAGAAFIVYAETAKGLVVRHYAVAPGELVEDDWPLDPFKDGIYRILLHGPNGFYREFQGSRDEPFQVKATMTVGQDGAPTGTMQFVVTDIAKGTWSVTTRDNAYGQAAVVDEVTAGGFNVLSFESRTSHGWYDVTLTCKEAPHWLRRCAGRIETGRWSITDPQMGSG